MCRVGPCRQGTSSFDVELADLAVCADCRGPASVHSSIVGDARRICVRVFHQPSCPTHWHHMAWTSADALDAKLFDDSLTTTLSNR